MKRKFINSLIFICCIFVLGIGCAFVVKSISGTYAVSASWLAIEYYNIDFDTQGGSGSFGTQRIQKGQNFKVSKPLKVPTKDGHTFRYWSTSPDGSEYNFDQVVNSSFTLYAVWKREIQTFTIRFDSNGGTGVSSQKVNEGSKVSKPADPSRNGFTFNRWSTTRGGAAYDFNLPVSKSFTLYAVWDEVPSGGGGNSGGGGSSGGGNSGGGSSGGGSSSVTYYNVSFDLKGGNGNASVQKIADGNKATKPGDPTKENATFRGWFSDSSCQTIYNFDNSVTSNITLYACYDNEYTVTFNREGLPFINNYTNKYKEGSNLLDFKRNFKLLIFDTTSYVMDDFDSCISRLSSINPGVSSNLLKERCNKISDTFNCNKNKCYANKYVILNETESDDIINLRTNDVLAIEYEVYNYLGLFKEKSCSSEYKYADGIDANMELYECFSFMNEESYEKEKEEEKKKSDKKGLSATWIMLIMAFVALIGFVLFIVIKSKRANRV